MPRTTPPPNVVCYTAALGACERAGQWQSVLDLLDEMRSAGVPPNVVTWSLAIRACADARLLSVIAAAIANARAACSSWRASFARWALSILRAHELQEEGRSTAAA